MLTLAIVAFLQSASAGAPSFDCAKARNFAERSICADAPLSQQDRKVAQLYKAGLADAASADAVRDDEASWLRRRDACTTRACLTRAYAARIATLQGAAQGPPKMTVGDCVTTQIDQLGSRLEGDPKSGSGVLYRNGLKQTAYSVLPGLAGASPGDPVRLCLVRLPHHCPRGDDRGKIYTGRDLRTGGRWRAADSEHTCGGA